MEGRFLTDELAAIADPAARRAAARSLWPDLAALVDAAVESPSKVSRVPAAALEAALLCCDDAGRAVLLDADRRQVAASLRRRGAARALGGLPPTVAVAGGHRVAVVVDGRYSAQGLFDALGDAPPHADAIAVLRQVLTCLRDETLPVDGSVVALADLLLRGGVVPGSPGAVHVLDVLVAGGPGGLEVLDACAPVGAHGLALACRCPAARGGRTDLWDHLRVDPAAADALATAVADGALFLDVPGAPGALDAPLLVLLDRVVGAPAAATVAVHLADGRTRPELLETLARLRTPAVAAAVAGAAADGALGTVRGQDDADRLVALGADPVRLAAHLQGPPLRRWLEGAEADDLERWAAQPGAAAQLSTVSLSPVWRRRAAAALALRAPGALALLVDEAVDCDRELAAAVLARAADALGGDALAWGRLWGVAAGWPGTVDEAVAVVLASGAQP